MADTNVHYIWPYHYHTHIFLVINLTTAKCEAATSPTPTPHLSGNGCFGLKLKKFSRPPSFSGSTWRCMGRRRCASSTAPRARRRRWSPPPRRPPPPPWCPLLLRPIFGRVLPPHLMDKGWPSASRTGNCQNQTKLLHIGTMKNTNCGTDNIYIIL